MILQPEKAALNKHEGSPVPTTQFRKDVIEGLGQDVKQLKSKYFYDATGDSLFQQIMALPEYYLTRCELDIFKNRTADIAAILADGSPFDLIELGAGDATKSSYLLEYLVGKNHEFTYLPIDISGNILSVLEEKLADEIPGLDIFSLEGDYFEMLDKASAISARRKVILFLGGNIGNMEKEDAHNFCRKLRNSLHPGDIALIGFDLKKNPKVILNAYNDTSGVTAAFNLNLLTRINRELNANFDLNHFEHYQNYDPLTGACRSYLVSLKTQEVVIDGQTIDFKEHECIYMEVSQKFSLNDIEQLANASGFEFSRAISDSKGWFMDAVWIAK